MKFSSVKDMQVGAYVVFIADGYAHSGRIFRVDAKKDTLTVTSSDSGGSVYIIKADRLRWYAPEQARASDNE